MNNIRYYRKLHNLSQGQLAIKLNVSINTISNWETGFNDPDLFHIKDLINFFDCTFEDIFIRSMENE